MYVTTAWIYHHRLLRIGFWFYWLCCAFYVCTVIIALDYQLPLRELSLHLQALCDGTSTCTLVHYFHSSSHPCFLSHVLNEAVIELSVLDGRWRCNVSVGYLARQILHVPCSVTVCTIIPLWKLYIRLPPAPGVFVLATCTTVVCALLLNRVAYIEHLSATVK